MSSQTNPDLLQVRADGDVTVAVVVPTEFRGAEADTISKQLYQLAEEANTPQLHLDLTNVRYMDSEGLAKVVSLHKKVRTGGGQLRLCNVNPFVYEVFSITNLTRLLDIQQKEIDGEPSWGKSA